MTNTIGFLQQIGLNEKEARLYLTSLELGPSTILTLAKKSGVKRTSIYNFLNEMIERGFMLYTINGKKTLYSAIEPEGLIQIIEKQKELASSILPELYLLSQKGSSIKPKIRAYEGIEGIKQIYEDTLKQPDGSEFVAFTSVSDAYKILPPSYIKSYLYRRSKVKKISVRVIVKEDLKSKEYIHRNKEELRETISIPEEVFPILNEVNIYQNKIAIISFGEEKIGIIIESPQIAKSQKAIFEALWKSLKILKKNRLKLS